MLKIYFGPTPIYLSQTPIAGTQQQIPYEGDSAIFQAWLNRLEQEPGGYPEGWTFYHSDFGLLLADFKQSFKYVEAAGGLVQHPDSGLYLSIYRKGHWDLPKGKIDPGETPQQAAVREVQEETGLRQPILGDLITITHHLYRDRLERWALKPTYWYHMQSEDQQVKGQIEEGIERVDWLTLAELKTKEPIFSSIKEVLARV